MAKPRLQPGWVDMLVIAAASIAFAAVVFSQGHSRTLPAPPTEEAIQALANELGVSSDELRRATEKVPPLPAGVRPTIEQRTAHHRALAAALALPPARVDAAFERFGPPHFERAVLPRESGE
jgi:hypothetical protein